MKRVVHATLALCLALMPIAVCGCIFNSGGDVDAVQPVSNLQRAGNVYILRGFMGVLSPGLYDLQSQCELDGVRTQVYENDQWREIADRLIARYRPDPHPEPLILIGHSFGADDAILISRRLADAGVGVDLLITLDPVLPDAVPVNVRRTINFYCPNGVTDFLPVFRGTDLKPADPSVALTNVDLNRDDPALAEEINHFNMGENQKMREEVIKLVLDTCPPKADWMKMRSQPATMPVAVALIHP